MLIMSCSFAIILALAASRAIAESAPADLVAIDRRRE